MKPLPIQESSTRFLRIALISSNHVTRMGLNMILKAHPFVSRVDDVSLGSNAVDIVVREKPQVIIVDLKLADADTLELIRKLRSAAADSHILVLSGLNDEELTRAALSSGAEGVVLKVQPPAVLFAAIESLCGCVPKPWGYQPVRSANGLNGVTPSAGTNKSEYRGFIEGLTSREREIIHFVAKGLKNKDVADRLCICETTVRHHLTAIFSKLHVSNRQQLLIMAHQRGLVELGAG